MPLGKKILRSEPVHTNVLWPSSTKSFHGYTTHEFDALSVQEATVDDDDIEEEYEQEED